VSNETLRELYRINQDWIQRQAYFLLAAAGAAIGFAVTQTRTAELEWSQLPLGAAVLCWGMSFYFGCQHLGRMAGIVRSDQELIKIQMGLSDLAGRNPAMIALGVETMQKLLQRESEKAGRIFRFQFELLIAGAGFYIAWHVLEMAIRAGIA
jgi:hypothetical protein